MTTPIPSILFASVLASFSVADADVVNPQMTDAAIQSNVKVTGVAPATAMGAFYQSTAHALLLAPSQKVQIPVSRLVDQYANTTVSINTQSPMVDNSVNSAPLTQLSRAFSTQPDSSVIGEQSMPSNYQTVSLQMNSDTQHRLPPPKVTRGRDLELGDELDVSPYKAL